jgi:hypothetical protein
MLCYVMQDELHALQRKAKSNAVALNTEYGKVQPKGAIHA